MWMTEKTIQNTMLPFPNTCKEQHHDAGTPPQVCEGGCLWGRTTPSTEKKMTTARQA